MKTRQSNEYITLGTIAIVDISTKKFPEASMKIDLDVWIDLLNQGIGRVSSDGMYAQTQSNGSHYRIHKLITTHFKFFVDHENADRFDNRMSNLRDVTQLENRRNSSLNANNTTGSCGISEWKGKKGSTWRATIRVNYKKVYIGAFKTLEKAIAARKAAEVKFGFHKNHGAK
tara:strand:+ start:889 stop:1404 length:516 start_codon:yes stop_codon:yes gene_type:complete